MPSEDELARRILDIIPLVMRATGADMRREAAAGFQVPHYRVLKLLLQQPRTLSELAACQAVALPTMSRTVSVLVERGWVTRSQDPRDRRRVQLRATDEGRAVFESLRARVQERLADRLAVLTAEEREQVLTGLRVLEKVFATEETRESR
ncbi:MAG: MarR family transcriptional regulator [Caldilineae bacterium]|nr:MAG: MarR family transcriptional regulator [Caldilineae bacterium]